MPLLDNGGIQIYWDAEGDGPPVLLIMGLGCGLQLWHRTRPGLAKSYCTIALDNRGAGRSDVPPGPYSIAAMASDAAAVLDAAGSESAHVLGFSMGGMIAQEFALQYSARVRSLILAGTSPGGPSAVKAEPAVRDLLMNQSRVGAEEFAQAAIPFLHDAAVPRTRIEEDLALRRQCFPTHPGYTAQLLAVFAWQAYDRLPQIHAPTLVIHGETDRMIPRANAEILAARIPGSKLVILPQAGHVFMTDQSEAAQQAILDFLAAQAVPKLRNEYQTAF